jgi:DNA-binding transcriptional LysR family regulator
MKTSDIDLDLLKAFVAVADQGSFTGAAEVISRTQSAVSQKVLRLEEALQMRLFERTSRSLHLTKDGERVLAAGRRLLDHYQAFVRELTDPPKTLVLRLGISENLLQTELPHVLTGLRQRYPGTTLDLTTGSSQELLAAHEAQQLDLVIARTSKSGAFQRGRVIWREPLVWVAHAGFRMDASAPAQLVMMRPPCVYRETMIEALESAGREWAAGCTVSSFSGVRAAVLGGLGVTVLSKSLVQEGMKVLRPSRHWPALPLVEVSVLGESQETRHIVETLVSLLIEALTGTKATTQRRAI